MSLIIILSKTSETHEISYDVNASLCPTQKTPQNMLLTTTYETYTCGIKFYCLSNVYRTSIRYYNYVCILAFFH